MMQLSSISEGVNTWFDLTSTNDTHFTTVHGTQAVSHPTAHISITGQIS